MMKKPSRSLSQSSASARGDAAHRREPDANAELAIAARSALPQGTSTLAPLRVSQASPQMHDLALLLIAHEVSENRCSGTHSLATFPIPEKLRRPLAALVGNTGFGALLSRALALASAEVPWLRALHVKADGSLGGMADLEVPADPAQIAQGRVALLAQLLELLREFIGENLTLQLMAEAWPKLVLDELHFENGEASEREK